MRPLHTDRLVLRPFQLSDAPFTLELLNEQAFLQFIGDRQVRTVEQARTYLQRGPLASDSEFQFGLVAVLADGSTAGMCGLLQRDGLDDPDIGFAFLERYWGYGYAREAAAAVLRHARAELQLPRVAAITDPTNARSVRMLEDLGMERIGPIRLADGEELLLFRVEFAPS